MNGGFIYGQTENAADSLDKEFDELIESTNKYMDKGLEYRVIRRSDLDELHESANNKLKKLSKTAEEQDEEIKEEKAEIDELEHKLDKTQKEKEEITRQKEQFSFLGLDMPQEVLAIFLLILIIALLIFIYLYKKSHAVTAETRENLENTKRDFDEYKQKALKSQQKLGRQLQDLRNERSKNKNE